MMRGVLLGCAIALPAAGLIIISLVACRYTRAESLLYAYQNLIAGVLALVGALVGAAYLNRQILAQREQEAIRRSRRHAAARAVMPHVLMSLSDYARDSVQGLQQARKLELAEAQFDADASVTSDVAPVKLPCLPDTLTRDFAEMIEATEGEDAQPFVDLLSDLQVQIARVSDLNNESRLSSLNHNLRAHELLLRLWDAVYIHAAASALFSYARQEPGVATAKPDWAMMETSALTLEIYDMAEFSQLMVRKQASDPIPRIVSSRPGGD